MSDVVTWLEEELEKRRGPWMGKDRKGNPEMKEPLATVICIMPRDASELLRLAKIGEQHCPEAAGRRMAEAAKSREKPNAPT